MMTPCWDVVVLRNGNQIWSGQENEGLLTSDSKNFHKKKRTHRTAMKTRQHLGIFAGVWIGNVGRNSAAVSRTRTSQLFPVVARSAGASKRLRWKVKIGSDEAWRLHWERETVWGKSKRSSDMCEITDLASWATLLHKVIRTAICRVKYMGKRTIGRSKAKTAAEHTGRTFAVSETGFEPPS